MRVVLDTNTLVSALVFHRERWTWLREAWKSVRVLPLLCPETATELIRVLAYPKFQLSSEDQRVLLEEVVPYCETVRTLPDDHLPSCRDPHDQVFLRLAHTGAVELLVSGDDDLLTYPGDVSFRIVSPAQLRTLLDKD